VQKYHANIVEKWFGLIENYLSRKVKFDRLVSEAQAKLTEGKEAFDLFRGQLKIMQERIKSDNLSKFAESDPFVKGVNDLFFIRTDF
jgi:hypothetical protein